MIPRLTTFALGAALAAAAAVLIDLWRRRHELRRRRELAELQRHRALPPLPPTLRYRDDLLLLRPRRRRWVRVLS